MIAFGFALAWAISSASDFAGTDGCTTTKKVLSPRYVIGVKSLTGSYGGSLRRLTTKYVLKKALRKILPPENLSRGKMGFGVPVGHWFRAEMQQFLRENLLSEKFGRRGFVKPEVVRRMVELHTRGERDHTHQLWTLLMLELWFQRFID